MPSSSGIQRIPAGSGGSTVTRAVLSCWLAQASTRFDQRVRRVACSTGVQEKCSTGVQEEEAAAIGKLVHCVKHTKKKQNENKKAISVMNSELFPHSLKMLFLPAPFTHARVGSMPLRTGKTGTYASRPNNVGPRRQEAAGGMKVKLGVRVCCCGSCVYVNAFSCIAGPLVLAHDQVYTTPLPSLVYSSSLALPRCMASAIQTPSAAGSDRAECATSIRGKAFDQQREQRGHARGRQSPRKSEHQLNSRRVPKK